MKYVAPDNANIIGLKFSPKSQLNLRKSLCCSFLKIISYN